jgi:sulfur carrier protein
MKIQLNGAERLVQEPCTVEQLLEQAGIKEETVAVEVNLEIVPKGQRQGRGLKEGDVVEILRFMGGG